MKTLANEMCFKMFQKCVSSIEDVVEEISLIKGQIGSIPYVQFQQTKLSSGEKGYDITVVSNRDAGPGSLDLCCSLQRYMNDFGFQCGWKTVSENSPWYFKIEEHLLS